MTFYAHTYGNLVKSGKGFTGEETAQAIARIEEKIRDLEVYQRRARLSTHAYAIERYAALTKEIEMYRRDIEEMKAEALTPVPMSQRFTAPDKTVYYFVERLDYDGSNDKDVALYVNGVYWSYSLGFTFSEAKNRLWESYCELNRVNNQSGLPL